VFGRERRIVAELAKELDGARGLEPVAILSGGIAMQTVLAVFEVEARDAEGLDVRVDDGGSTDETQDDVGCSIVAERGGEAKNLAQRDVDIGAGIFVLQRAESALWEEVARKKANGLVEGEFSLLDLVQRAEGERQLEDGLHGRMGLRFEIAIEARAGQRTGDGDGAVGVGGDFADFVLQRSLGEEGRRKEG